MLLLIVIPCPKGDTREPEDDDDDDDDDDDEEADEEIVDWATTSPGPCANPCCRATSPCCRAARSNKQDNTACTASVLCMKNTHQPWIVSDRKREIVTGRCCEI